MTVPAGLEEFFVEVGKPGTDISSPPVDDAEVEKLLSGAPKYGVEIPPPSEQYLERKPSDQDLAPPLPPPL